MTIEILYGAVLLAISVAVFAMTLSLKKMDKRISRVDRIMTDSLANLAKTVSDVVDTTTVLSDKMNEMSKEPEDVSSKIEKEIDRAREQVFTEWINGIVNYDPFKTGGT